MARQLIECRHNQLSPGVVVCVHLMMEQSKEWRAIPSDDPSVAYDWVCPKCMERGPHGSFDDLSIACVGCINKHRRNLGLPLIGDRVRFRPNENGVAMHGLHEAEVIGFHGEYTGINFNNEQWALTADEIVEVIPME